MRNGLKTSWTSEGFRSLPSFEDGLPANVEAERSLLGAILLNNTHFHDAEEISWNDFSLDSHRRIFAVMAQMMEEGRPVDIVTMSDELRRRSEVAAIGGIAYLAALTDGSIRPRSVREYVRIVKEKSSLRALIDVCRDAVTLAADQSIHANDIIEETDTRLLEISANAVDAEEESLAITAMNEFKRLVEEKEQNRDIVGLSTGIGELDAAVNGYVEGELTVVAGRPGQGKTSLLIQAMIACGEKEIPAHVFQLELSKGAMLRRMFAMMADIPYARFRNAALLHSSDLTRIEEAARVVGTFPLIIETNPMLTVQQVVSRARVSKRRGGTCFVGVDYLQKINYGGTIDNRAVAVTDAVVRLANLAKTESLAILVLSSLTEKSGRDRNSVPSLAELRLSGDIQYEASTICLIHREYDENDGLCSDGMIYIPKQRNGHTGRLPLRYDDTCRFISPVT